jgi:ribosomal protein S18 acetylase RimI-like enzyme
MPPAANMDDFLTIFRSGLWRLSWRLSAEGKKRFFTEFLPLLHDTKASILGPRDNESWYLVYLGTKKSARGQGLARKVVEKVSSMVCSHCTLFFFFGNVDFEDPTNDVKADAEKKPCYLESSNAKNPAIYRKWGFELARKIHLQRAKENIELDIMVREPKQHLKKDSVVDELMHSPPNANDTCRPC